MRPPPAVVGIDLGAATSRVAVYGDGGPRLLEDAQGRRAIPSAVAFGPDGRVMVGTAARRNAMLMPRSTIGGATRLLGRRWDSPDTQRVRERCSFDVVQAPSGDAWVRAGTTAIGPAQIAASLLEALAAAASQTLGAAVKRAVVTVPAGFDDAQRKAMRDVGLLASVEIVRLLNAPTAAALAYGFGRSLAETVAVVDVGAATTEVAIVRCEDGLVEVLGLASDLVLGGDDIDRRIATIMRDEVYAVHGVDVGADPMAMHRLLEEAAAAKHALSEAADATLALPHLMMGADGPITLTRPISRAELEAATTDLTTRMLELGNDALSEARREPGDIDALVIVGGATRAPDLQRGFETLFGRDAARGVHRDEAVAIGAAIASAILDGHIGELAVVDVAAHTIGMRASGDRFIPIIRRSAATPARVRKVFASSPEAGKRVVLEVYQGDDAVASHNRRLARLRIAEPAGAPRAEHVEVVFTIDTSGCLAITARDPKSGRPCAVEID